MSVHNFISRYIKINNKMCVYLFFKKKRYFYQTPIDSFSRFSDKNIKDVFELAQKFEDKILFSSVIEANTLKLGYIKNKVYEDKVQKERIRIQTEFKSVTPIPLSLKLLVDNSAIKENDRNDKPNEEIIEKNTITQFPYEKSDDIGKTNIDNAHLQSYNDMNIKSEVLDRHVNYENFKARNWMTDFESYDDENVDVDINSPNWHVNYGTPNPNSTISNVACGGCGSLLHCKDTSIPGYVPSEIFYSSNTHKGQELNSLTCQRCHFLRYYDMALQVRVSSDNYPRILMKIKENVRALVILMVDILDFPCSLWPNVIDIIGRRQPVFVVGNKVDLLPQDSRGYLERIKKILNETIQKSGISKANIINVSLISAKTGYGVEELVTNLHSLWGYKGDVYLVGCTNVGKSTLFNTLLQSDYCKSQASSLIQKATTSPWPGTTMNLLKFPILRPSGWRLYVRTKRLESLNRIRKQEERLRKIQFKKTNNPKYAMLIGHIEQTFSTEEPIRETKDMFSIKGQPNASGKTKLGLNENDSIYKLSKWCYDTPGVVHPAQILHLLTAEELLLTLPKRLILPKTFSLKPGTTIFLAGLGRLDYIDGPKAMRFTVFISENLPITICNTLSADDIYKEFLGTEMFKVPVGKPERLNKWPALQAGDLIKLKGLNWETSCVDIILSSAGWISVTCGENIDFVLQGWTPEKRGLYVRDSILPKSVSLRGRKIRFSPAYTKSKFFKS